MKKGSFLIILLLLVALGSLGAGIFFLARNETKKDVKQESVKEWKTFVHPQFGYSFNYPTDWDTLELSESQIVAPKNIITRLREAKSLGGFGGSTDFTLQIFFGKDAYDLNDYKTSDFWQVTRNSTKVDGRNAVQFDTVTLQSAPGIEKGHRTKIIVFEYEDNKVRFDLLDLEKADVLNKILDSFTYQPIVGKTTEQVQKIKGIPSYREKNTVTNKEVWIYALSKEDSTSQYLYIKDNKVVDVKVDEFSGSLESDEFLREP